MKSATISEAKAHLSRYLRHVRAGNRVRIFDRNVPVADLVPIEAGAEDEGDARLRALERQGIIRRGRGGPLSRDLFRPGPRPRRGASATCAVDALLDERRHRR